MNHPQTSSLSEVPKPISVDRPLVGKIVSVNGAQAIVQLDSGVIGDFDSSSGRPELGNIVIVEAPRSTIVGVISGLSTPMPSTNLADPEMRLAELDLVGELNSDGSESEPAFKKGISNFPTLGDKAFRATQGEIEIVYDPGDRPKVSIGKLHQNTTIEAHVLLDQLLSRHFAVLGTTGAGKSCGLALILRGLLELNLNSRIVLLDPHGEYKRCFGEFAEVITLQNLQLPYWLLNQEEISEVLVGNQASKEEQVEILANLIPEAKRIYSSGGGAGVGTGAGSGTLRRTGSLSRVTLDTPTPYRMSDLTILLDNAAGRNSKMHDALPYKKLKARIEQLSVDARYAFMFGNIQVLDQMAEILGRLFRIPINGKPFTIIDLSGVPSEVINVVVSVLARMAFELALWSEGKVPLTLVCEEAHRYVPRDSDAGFEPTKQALSRIAKEGRKYGISLGLVSQRPSELSATILSQCNTVFAMRMTNQVDQQFVNASVSVASGNLLDFLPSLGDSEAIAIGEGVSLPARIKFNELEREFRPTGKSSDELSDKDHTADEEDFLADIVSVWRARRRDSI